MKSYSLITGGSNGIGLATAHALAAQRRGIILVARNQEHLTQAAEKLAGADIKTFALDIRDDAQVDALFDTLSDCTIDIVVNNAGLALGKETLDEYDFADIHQMIDTNITGLLKVTHRAIPFLRKTKGHIVNLSSIAGREAYEGGLVYCSTKAFVKMLSKGLRIDLAGTGIRVTDIAPGAVETNFSNVRFKGDTERAGKVYEGWTPLQPKDIADCIAFAVSRPAHVNIDEMLIMPTQQASVGRVMKDA